MLPTTSHAPPCKDRPYMCFYAGCTKAYKNKGDLRTHEVMKHGRKRKYIKSTTTDNMMAAQGTQPTEASAQPRGTDEPVLDPGISVDNQADATDCTSPHD